MKLRQAIVDDADAITRIWNTEIREGVSTFNKTEKSVSEVLDIIEARGAAVLVAVDDDADNDDQVLGFATWAQFRGSVGYRHTFEHTIYLDHTARGCGLGRDLMQAIENGARRDGVHVLVACIGGENDAAVAFHARMGFEHAGHMPEVGRKFGRWMDLVLMQKLL
ncbi:N-acetyltransferase family protein [Shimia sp.]|uniref:GNAT family N-acetyltransferase n=1 Tax=Shimia sp. TaxID=1954381 RepID=UPI0032990DC9